MPNVDEEDLFRVVLSVPSINLGRECFDCLPQRRTEVLSRDVRPGAPRLQERAADIGKSWTVLYLRLVGFGDSGKERSFVLLLPRDGAAF